jgi:replicative DNA helicase
MSIITDLRDQVDPVPPYVSPSNVAAEQALLGAILCDNRGFAQIAEIVRPEDFYEAVHDRIFDAIGKMINIGKTANPVTLKHLFNNDPAIRKLYGGGKYLAQLAECAVTLRNNRDYALIIADLALRRSLIAALAEPEAGQTTLDILEAMRPRIQALAKAVGATPARRGADGQ